ncbi:glycosyltransferase family 1 protein [Clostridium chromiireducens]|uniref:glycosyltransferase family 1 protein n=1 Tax=Clostridium chromiireducens TaxID=225345 RepID=UPI003AF47C51
MIRVLTVVKGLEVNGVSNVVFTYYKSLDKSQIAMDFSTGESIDDRYRKEIEYNGNKLYIIKNRDSNPLKYIQALAAVIRKNRYDVVHVHGNSAMISIELLAAFLGGAKVRIAHSHNTTCDHLKVEKLMRIIFYHLCNVRIACGESAGEWMFRKRKFLILKNGIDLKQYIYSEEVRQKVRQKLGIDRSFVVGHVGTFNYQKNQEFLVDIFAELLKNKPEALLLLVGSGEAMEDVKAKVQTLGIQDNVIFYGLANNVPELMMAMDVLVLPSRFEGLPCVLVEAQALGLPCIVSDKVSKEVAMTELLTFEKLENAESIWVKSILESYNTKRNLNAKNSLKKLELEGYDIINSVKKLEECYLSKL